MTAEEVNAWLKYMDEVDWTLSRGDKVNYRNFRRSLRKLHSGLDVVRRGAKAHDARLLAAKSGSSHC